MGLVLVYDQVPVSTRARPTHSDGLAGLVQDRNVSADDDVSSLASWEARELSSARGGVVVATR